MRLVELISGRRRFAPPPRPVGYARRSRRLSAGEVVAALALTTTLLVALIVLAAVMEARLGA